MKVRIARIAKRMHNKFRGLYWRQMFVTVGMVLLTLFLLGVSFFSLSYNYARGQENGELAAQAQVVGQLSASYLENGRYLDMEELQHEEDFRCRVGFAIQKPDVRIKGPGRLLPAFDDKYRPVPSGGPGAQGRGQTWARLLEGDIHPATGSRPGEAAAIPAPGPNTVLRIRQRTTGRSRWGRASGQSW